jgi:hypothetical protein
MPINTSNNNIIHMCLREECDGLMIYHTKYRKLNK